MSEQDGGRHPVNIGHLVMGIAFLGLVGIWALVQGDVVNDDDIRWLLPIPWVFAGVAGLLATTLSAQEPARHPADRLGQAPGSEADERAGLTRAGSSGAAVGRGQPVLQRHHRGVGVVGEDAVHPGIEERHRLGVGVALRVRVGCRGGSSRP